MAARPDVEAIRKRHHRVGGRGVHSKENYGCVSCSDAYPCATEQVIAYALAVEQERDRLRAWVSEQGHGLICASQPEYPGEAERPCSCGLDTALGLAAGKHDA